ncbi:hypothetical protein [Capnocytophaga stomatis]|nr:hypothetical protein [Capnocytophaga stomatis]
MMKEMFYFFITLFLMSCSVGKQIALIQKSDDTPIRITISDYSSQKKITIVLRKKLVLKNVSTRHLRTNIGYFVYNNTDFELLTARLVELNEKYNRFITLKSRNEISLSPLSNKEVIYEIWKHIEKFDSGGIVYKSLKQYLTLGKHPIRENGLTGEKYEDTMVLYYEEPFSEFKRKNPELLEFLTKGDSIELEVISPVKQKYKFKAEW